MQDEEFDDAASIRSESDGKASVAAAAAEEDSIHIGGLLDEVLEQMGDKRYAESHLLNPHFKARNWNYYTSS
jgi:hypothetical protein